MRICLCTRVARWSLCECDSSSRPVLASRPLYTLNRIPVYLHVPACLPACLPAYLPSCLPAYLPWLISDHHKGSVKSYVFGARHTTFSRGHSPRFPQTWCTLTASTITAILFLLLFLPLHPSQPLLHNTLWLQSCPLWWKGWADVGISLSPSVSEEPTVSYM